MDISEHIAAVRAEGDLMAGVLGTVDIETPVPTCPDWVVRDLVKHLGGVHRWATAFVKGGLTGPGDVNFDELMASFPDDPGVLDWFVDGHAALVHALETASPDVACWTFMPAPSPLSFWARRQSHETAIHRVDAQLAAEVAPSGCEPSFAAAGIDEFLTGFITRHKVEADAGPSSVEVRCNDVEANWLVRVDPSGVTTERGGGTGDCTVSGSASDLFFTLWNRRAASGLRVEGDEAALRMVLGVARVRWV